MCEWTELDTIEGPNTPWRATTSGVTRTIEQPITNFKMIGFLAIATGNDGVSHRQTQWFPSAWLQNILSEANANKRKILFNFTRDELGRRAWVTLVQGRTDQFNWSKVDGGTDTYDLIVWGLK